MDAGEYRERLRLELAGLGGGRGGLPYTASDPEHPPKWRAGFELWPGNILYIADDPEPAASDVARVWFARRQTGEGLDAAASTPLPGEHSQMLVPGDAMAIESAT